MRPFLYKEGIYCFIAVIRRSSNETIFWDIELIILPRKMGSHGERTLFEVMWNIVVGYYGDYLTYLYYKIFSLFSGLKWV